MKNIQTEIERCHQLEKALTDRGLDPQTVKIRVTALEWALAQLQNRAPAQPANNPQPQPAPTQAQASRPSPARK